MEDSIDTMMGVGPVGGILEETISWQELSQVEKQYHKEIGEGNLQTFTRFQYAQKLVKSQYQADILKGIKILEDILGKDTIEVEVDEVYHSLALGLTDNCRAIKFPLAVFFLAQKSSGWVRNDSTTITNASQLILKSLLYAVGYGRLGDYKNGLFYIRLSSNSCVGREELENELSSCLQRNGWIGVGIVAGASIATALLIALIVKKCKK